MSSGVVSKPNASASGSTFLDVFLGCDDEDVAVAAAGGGGGLVSLAVLVLEDELEAEVFFVVESLLEVEVVSVEKCAV